MLRILTTLTLGAFLVLSACSEESTARPSLDFRPEQSSFFALKSCDPERVMLGTLLSEFGGNSDANVRIFVEGHLYDSLTVKFHEPLEELVSEEFIPFGPKIGRGISIIAPRYDTYSKDTLDINIEVGRGATTLVEQTKFLFFQENDEFTYANYSAPVVPYVYPVYCWPGYQDGRLPGNTSYKLFYEQQVKLEKTDRTSRVTIKISESQLVSESNGQIYTLPPVEPLVFDYDVRLPGKAYDNKMIKGESEKVTEANVFQSKSNSETVTTRLNITEERDSIFPGYRPIGSRVGGLRKVKLLACGVEDILSIEDINVPFKAQLSWTICQPDWFPPNE